MFTLITLNDVATVVAPRFNAFRILTHFVVVRTGVNTGMSLLVIIPDAR